MLALDITALLLSLAALFFGLKRDLMMLQQNSNRNDRYRRWMRESGESTRVSRLMCMAIAAIFLIVKVPSIVPLALMAVAGLWNTLLLATSRYKKPLVFTHRAVRIFSVSLVLVAALSSLSLFIDSPGRTHLQWLPFFFTAGYAVSYWFVLAANWLLKPVERHINRGYYNDAARILASMPDLKVIGITGSYGKTSTKHYLHRILSEKYDVLMTPGNFNTTLGVIRTVREHLKPYNEVFIAEMGAKQISDIREICDLVHPTMGIITAVGPQHLESFGSIENVQRTKFELADALPADGLIVVNNDFEFIANRKVGNTGCVRYAVDNLHAADYHAHDITYSADGTRFTISDADGEVISLHTRLVGKCNVSNLTAAVIVALRLGVPTEKIRYAVEKIEQVEHRLDMKRTASGITIIDDAYNSNPVGSAMALEVLGGMTSGKRIVITPGMIELGDDQYELNRRFGENIASSADVAIIVGEYNRQAITDGLTQAGFPDDRVHLAASFADAQRIMLSLASKGDTVLYENDLPDTFK